MPEEVTTPTQQAPAPVYQITQGPIMSTGDWFMTQLVLAIPLLNIIMLIVWAAGSTGNENRRNFCRATLLWSVIAIGIYILIFFFMLIAAGGKSS